MPLIDKSEVMVAGQEVAHCIKERWAMLRLKKAMAMVLLTKKI